MDVKTQESPGWTDEAAKVAHDTVDNLREYAAKMEAKVGKKATVSAGRIGTGLEGRVRAIGDFVEANPVRAAVMAFGMGVWASQVFKSMESRLSQADSGAVASKLRKTAQT